MILLLLLNNKKQLISLTTLVESEFMELCACFKAQHDLHFSKKNLLGKKRKRGFKEKTRGKTR